MEIHGWYANHPCLYHLVPKYTWYYMMIHLESSQLFQCQYGSRICRKDLHILFVRKGLPRNDHWLSLMFCWLCKLLVLNCWLNTILSIHIQLLLILRVDINVHIHVVHQWFVHFWLYIYQESSIKIIKYWWLLMIYTGLYTNIYQHIPTYTNYLPQNLPLAPAWHTAHRAQLPCIAPRRTGTARDAAQARHLGAQGTWRAGIQAYRATWHGRLVLVSTG